MNQQDYEALLRKEITEVQASLREQQAFWEQTVSSYLQWDKVRYGYFRLFCRMIEAQVEEKEGWQGLRVWYPAFEMFYREQIESKLVCIGTISAYNFVLDVLYGTYKVEKVHLWLMRYKTFFDEKSVLHIEEEEGEARDSLTIEAAYDILLYQHCRSLETQK